MARDDEEEYDYATLVTRRKRERASVSLTRMPEGFYDKFDAHLRGLREEYTREHAANPATPKVLILQDELMKLQEARDDIYDVREKKLLTAAIVAARGGNPDRANMTKDEEALFDEVLRTLREARRNMLRRQLAPPKDATKIAPVASEPKPPAGPPTPPEPAPAPAFAAQPAAVLAVQEAPPEAPLPGQAAAPAPPAPVATEAVSASEDSGAPRRLGPQRALVRVRQAIEPFVGPDLRQYRLLAEDVAAVPREVAQVLVARQLAVLV